MYRPKDFKNPFSPSAIIVRDRNDKPISHHDAYEAGADALLEGLKKEGYSTKEVGMEYFEPHYVKGLDEPITRVTYPNGYLVFIPKK